MDKDQSTDGRKRDIPEPPHPRERREPLPWQVPKAAEEDPEAVRRVQAILNSSSYRLFEEDLDFLPRNDLRGKRLYKRVASNEVDSHLHEGRSGAQP